MNVNAVLVSGLIGALMLILLAPSEIVFARGGTGGGGSIAPTILQVAGTWRGVANYNPATSALRSGAPFYREVELTLTQSGKNLTGLLTLQFFHPFEGWDYIFHGTPILGTASNNSMKIDVDRSLYSMKHDYQMSETGTTICPDGSTGRVLSGTFSDFDINGTGSGTVSLNNCPATTPLLNKMTVL